MVLSRFLTLLNNQVTKSFVEISQSQLILCSRFVIADACHLHQEDSSSVESDRIQTNRRQEIFNRQYKDFK